MSKTTLKVWMISTFNNNDFPTFLKICREIQEDLGIDIDTKLISWNRAYDSLIQAFKDEKPPDVFVLGSTWVYTFSRLGYLAPVPHDLGIPPSIASWMDECATYSGVRYAVPWTINPLVLSTRKSYLEKYQIAPSDMSDWQSFYQVCSKISEEEKKASSNRIPFVFPVKPDLNTLHIYVTFMYKMGWNFPELTTGNKHIFDHRVFVEVFDYITRLMNLSSVKTTDDLHVLSRMLYDKFYYDGDCAFYIDSGNPVIAEMVSLLLQDKKYEGPFTLLPIPQNGLSARGYAGGGLFVVSSSCKEQELAWEVVKHFTSDGAVDSYTASRGNLPAFQCSFWEKYSDEPLIKMLYDEVKNSTSYPFHPLWRNIELIIANGIYNFFWQLNHSSQTNSQSEIKRIVDEMNATIYDLMQIIWENKK